MNLTSPWREELTRGAERDAIPAIVDPAFNSDWSGLSLETRYELGVFGEDPRFVEIEPRLADDDVVVGVLRGGRARAYPLRVLDWHEVVNDELGGPLLVSYCPSVVAR